MERAFCTQAAQASARGPRGTGASFPLGPLILCSTLAVAGGAVPAPRPALAPSTPGSGLRAGPSGHQTARHRARVFPPATASACLARLTSDLCTKPALEACPPASDRTAHYRCDQSEPPRLLRKRAAGRGRRSPRADARSGGRRGRERRAPRPGAVVSATRTCKTSAREPAKAAAAIKLRVLSLALATLGGTAGCHPAPREAV